MSTTSLKSVPTLKGIFSVPKTNHRKDFLRENKLNLRELQRVTTKNKSAQQEELHQKQQKQQQLHQQQQQQYVGRRAASQERFNRRSASQQRNATTKQNLPSRSISQQRGKEVHPVMNTRCPSCNGCGEMMGKESTTTLVSKAETCNIGIQTDDIDDEQFLHEALKKCSSSESNQSQLNLKYAEPKPLQREQEVFNKLECLNPEDDNDNDPLQEQQIYTEDNTNNFNHNHNGDNDVPNSARLNSARSQYSGRMNNYRYDQTEEQYNDLNMGALAIDNHGNQQSHVPISGRSRRTNCTLRSQGGLLSEKKSTGSIHKAGSRDDLRLPRYLEREKREKEERRMREELRDTNCPIGHFALTNDERLASLANAEQRFETLVNELNHMPMTMETLRIRTRKAEIEKELAMLEADIRLYSKQKVYMKQ